MFAQQKKYIKRPSFLFFYNILRHDKHNYRIKSIKVDIPMQYPIENITKRHLPRNTLKIYPRVYYYVQSFLHDMFG